jgi:hypothetical protein
MTGQKVEDQCGGSDPALGARAMDERPLYCAIGRLVLPAAGPVAARVIEAGEQFDWDGIPNNAFRPLNAAARAAKLKSIPLHWREATRPEQTIRLAKSLGYIGTDGAAARAHIENFETEVEKESTP